MTEQAPGFYRRKVGDVVVTAVNDGFIDLPFAAFPGLADADATALLAAAFRPPVARTMVGCYLVQGGGRTVLIDTGAGTLFGPTMGRLPANLQAAGVQPGDIDLILLTHAHGDHVGGLTRDGAAVFPKAQVAMAEAERSFWLDGDASAMPEGKRDAFKGAQASVRAALAPYMDRTVGFDAAPGITPVPLPGHTPGHTGFRIGEGADAVLIWGDVIHVQDIQAPRPEVGLMFDTNPEQAIETRKRALDMAANERLLIAGMHLHFPTFHHVARVGGGYALVPEMWSPTP